MPRKDHTGTLVPLKPMEAPIVGFAFNEGEANMGNQNNPNQNPGQQSQNPSQKPGQQQGGGHKPGQQQQDPNQKPGQQSQQKGGH